MYLHDNIPASEMVELPHQIILLICIIYLVGLYVYTVTDPLLSYSIPFHP